MNADMMKSLVTSLLAVAGGYLVGSGKLTSEQWSSLTNNVLLALPAVVAAGAIVAKLFQHTDAAKVEQADKVTGTKILVNMRTASPAVQAVANDPSNDVKPV